MDGKIDGKFIIKKGGITQGIANELGLTRAECKQISGSIWTQVINEFNNEQNMNVQNNRGAKPNADNNYTVHENAIITFSKECWSKIVGLINSALGKNIQVEEDEQPEQTNQSESTSNDVTAKNEQNLQNAYNELKSMTGLFVKKYNLDENQFVKSLEDSYQAILGSLPDSPCNTADLAMNVLMNTLKELMPDNEREAVKNAVIEVAQHYKDVEGANIAGISCKDIIGSSDQIEEVTNLYTAPANAENFVQVAREAIDELVNAFDKMTFPKEVNKQELLEKLKNYNPEDITNLGQHYRFGLKFNENPSKADIAVAILSDIMGMNGDKADREIQSEITLRQTAVDNVMKMYDDDMTLRGTKFSEVKNRAEKHKQAIDEARNYIKTNFKTSGLGKQVDENLFIACLNSITLDIESSGAGRVEDGVLAIETNDTEITKWESEGTLKAQMTKLLLHETYHLYLEKVGQHGDTATKEEEATAEMFALRTMANLCNNDSSLKPFEIYGHPISYYTSNETVVSNPEFTSWVSGYTGHTGTVDEAVRKAQGNVRL